MGNRSGSVIHRLNQQETAERLSSKPSASSDVILPTTTTNLETFLLVWLDPHVNTSEENVRTQRRLREILTCLVTFDEVNACERWLKKSSSDDKIILIVSGTYGQQIVPRIHSIPTLVMIYVYCLDTKRNKGWAKDFPKIRSVQSNTSKLLEDLSSNQSNLESVEDSKALNVYKHKQQVHSLDVKTAAFVWYHFLLEILVSPMYLQSIATIDTLTLILRDHSSGDEYGTKLISEFEQTYKPKKAIVWITRDTPSARLINKALREQDIEMMFALRFLLADVRALITERQASSRLNVFKIQLMPRSEMENLKAHPGQLVVIHGFLFASTSVPSLQCAVATEDHFETVVMNIEADVHPDAAPFAFLDEIEPSGAKQADREVVFMCGSMFEVGSLICENSIWTLHLKLVGDNKSFALLPVTEKLRENHSLCIIGDLLHHCDQTEKAMVYYRSLLNELPVQHRLISEINRKLIQLTFQSSTEPVFYLLINLGEHMTEFALSVLRVLRLMSSELILTVDSDSAIDFAQWSKSSTSIFTTVQHAPSSGNIPKDWKLFLLDPANHTIGQHRFGTMDDMICQLAEAIIQGYRPNDSQPNDVDDTTKAAEQHEYASRIHDELRKIKRKPKTKSPSVETAEISAAPSLIWLMKDVNGIEVSDGIQRTFKEYFSSFLTFIREDEFHCHVAQENDRIDKFIIIDSNHPESIVTNLQEWPQVKYAYHQQLANRANQGDLRYRLMRDLIDYYGKLGEQYRVEKQRRKARLAFLQAKNLCHLLSQTYFSEE